MAIENIDINQIAVTLSQLIQNYNELAQNWFDIFYNPIPKDIEIKFFDTEGNLKTYMLKNRAKDMNLIYNGEGAPEGLESAPTGSIYMDTLNGNFYVKRATEGDNVSPNNWQWVQSTTEIHQSGATEPDKTIEAPIGTLYTDTSTGFLWAMTQEGWKQVGASGFAEKAWCEDEFEKLKKEIGDGVVHKDGDEEMGGYKIFKDGIDVQKPSLFEDITTFKKIIMGTAYRALSADIAEYYEADKELEAGTLIQFGGDKEITSAKDMVNGVVSTSPAYILNGDNNMENPTLLALSGRVPVKVKGIVKKFDLITLSDEEGVAIVDNSCYNPIGRALEENLEEGIKLVECVVKLKV